MTLKSGQVHDGRTSVNEAHRMGDTGRRAGSRGSGPTGVQSSQMKCGQRTVPVPAPRWVLEWVLF